jgi:hypothetical protein
LPLVHLSSRLFGNFLVSMPYVNYGGIVAESAQAAQALADHAAGLAHDLGCSYIEYRHTDAGVLDLPSTTRKVSMVLPLPAAVDALWAGFKPKLRAQIRRAGKAGAAFEIGGAELLPDVLRRVCREHARSRHAGLFATVLRSRLCGRRHGPGRRSAPRGPAGRGRHRARSPLDAGDTLGRPHAGGSTP